MNMVTVYTIGLVWFVMVPVLIVAENKGWDRAGCLVLWFVISGLMVAPLLGGR
jgi:hypothetical protein